MCSSTAVHRTRRSSRRVRPGDKPSGYPLPKKQIPHHTTPTAPTTRTTASTSTTSTSSSKSNRNRERSLRTGTTSSSSEVRIKELQRKICPITGVLRNISSDYHIFSTVLGKGHYGCVRECEHFQTRKLYAVKSLDKTKIRRIDRLRREVYLLYKMDHDGIMKMVDCYEDAKFVHIVTERYTGGELFDKISEKTTSKGCLEEEDAVAIIKTLLEAVAYLHSNDIVHRDIKPENILFESSRDDSAVKLIDFGLSRKHKKSGEALMNNPVGTAYYMAPEVLEGAYDQSCDIWSIGTIVYITLCGYPPFNGGTDPQIFDAIKRGTFEFPKAAWAFKSEEVKDFIKCLLRMDPNKRLTAKEALKHPWITGRSFAIPSVVSSISSPDRCGCANDAEDRKRKEILKKIRQTIQRFRKLQLES